MKKVTGCMLAGCFLWTLLTSFSFAGPLGLVGDITVKVTPVPHSRSFVLRIYNMERRPARIHLRDAKGRIYYSELILEHNGYRKLINLRNLSTGQYLLQVWHPKGNQSRNLLVKPSGIVVLDHKGTIATEGSLTDTDVNLLK